MDALWTNNDEVAPLTEGVTAIALLALKLQPSSLGHGRGGACAGRQD
jgi:hypothetical protein